MSVGITADAYAQAYPFHLACKQGNDKIIMKYMGSKKLSTNLNKPDHLGRVCFFFQKKKIIYLKNILIFLIQYIYYL